MMSSIFFPFFFFFNDTATTEIYTLSLHDALPICVSAGSSMPQSPIACSLTAPELHERRCAVLEQADRKSTRLNSSHLVISYAVFCLKKKKKMKKEKINGNAVMTIWYAIYLCRTAT